MRRLLKVMASLALVAVAVAVLPQGAAADTSFTISPTLLEFAADPGASSKQVITVANEGTEPIHIYLSIKDTAPDSPGVSASGWLRVDVNEFELAPGKTQGVNVTMDIPKDAAPGGHYATVFFQTSPLELGERVGRVAAGTGMGVRVGSVFMITVRGPALELKADVVKVVPVAVGPDRLGFRLEIKNTGNVHTVPKAEVELKDLNGNTVGRLTLPEVTPLLPGSTRSYYLNGSLPVPPADYKATAQVDYSWEQFQSEATKVDPKQWSQQEVQKEISFNSVPKLRIVGIEPIVKEGQAAQFQVAVENVGDVEVMPVGWVDVLTSKGERAFTLNVGDGKWAVGPHSSANQKVTYQGLLPAGEYSITSSFSYSGQEPVEQSVPLKVARDVAPPAAPTVRPAPQAQLRPTEGGFPLWAWGLVAVGAVAIVGGGFAVFWLRRRSAA